MDWQREAVWLVVAFDLFCLVLCFSPRLRRVVREGLML